MTQPGMKKLVFKLGTLAVLVGMVFAAPLAARGYDDYDHRYGRTCTDQCLEQYKVCLNYCNKNGGGLLCTVQCTLDKIVCQTFCEL